MRAGVDLTEVLAGRTNFTPARLLNFIEQLPEDAAYRASIAGGPEYRAWNLTNAILADIWDALNTNTIATGMWGKKKPPKIPNYPRPWVVEEEQKPKTLEGFHSQLIGSLGGGGAHQL